MSGKSLSVTSAINQDAYSKNKMSVREMRSLKRSLEKYDYSCGAEIVPDGQYFLLNWVSDI